MSFGYREERSAIQAIRFITDRIRKVGPRAPREGHGCKVTRERYESFKGKKARFKSKLLENLDRRKGKRSKAYIYDYYIYLNEEKEKLSLSSKFTFRRNYSILNVDVVKCFDRISHSSILELTPLTDKYLFLLKS